MDLKAAAQILCDMPHTKGIPVPSRYDTGAGEPSLEIVMCATAPASVPSCHRRTWTRCACACLVALVEASRIICGITGGDTRPRATRPQHRLHTHQAKSMDDITQLLCEAVAPPTAQIGAN